MKSLFLIIILANILLISRQDAVCTESILLTELLQDIADNGKLDCLREPLPAPTDHIETDDERKKRKEAVWDTDCSFEADYDWLSILKRNYGLKTGLVDRDGISVQNDFSDQADMCEIIRAFIAGGRIEGYKLDNLSPQILDSISCPGDESQSQICAATGGSGTQDYSWYIFLNGSSLSADNKPKWKFSESSKLKLGVVDVSDS